MGQWVITVLLHDQKFGASDGVVCGRAEVSWILRYRSFGVLAESKKWVAFLCKYRK